MNTLYNCYLNPNIIGTIVKTRIEICGDKNVDNPVYVNAPATPAAPNMHIYISMKNKLNSD